LGIFSTRTENNHLKRFFKWQVKIEEGIGARIGLISLILSIGDKKSSIPQVIFSIAFPGKGKKRDFNRSLFKD
jgi:hypothetical protein